MAESRELGENEISVYCNHLKKTITSMIEEAAGDNEKVVVLSACQERCNSICNDIDEQKSQVITDAALCKCLQSVAKLVLDLTFVEENSLIEEEFPLQSAFDRVRNILETLQSVMELAKSASQNKSISDVLSAEIIECIFWRQGALLYMYSHTLDSQFSVENMPVHSSQCLKDGIRFLVSMLCVRSSPKWLTGQLLTSVEEDSSHEVADDANLLLDQGILSDTHLLALMYCGEMCYWYTQQHMVREVSETTKHPNSDETKSNMNGADMLEISFCKDCSQSDASSFSASDSTISGNKSVEFNASETKASVPASVTQRATAAPPSVSDTWCSSEVQRLKSVGDIVRTGQLSLENYIKAARGPMLVGGWSTTRAEEILNYFHNLKL